MTCVCLGHLCALLQSVTGTQPFSTKAPFQVPPTEEPRPQQQEILRQPVHREPMAPPY